MKFIPLAAISSYDHTAGFKSASFTFVSATQGLSWIILLHSCQLHMF